MISSSKVVAYHRCCPDRIADKSACKNHADIHHYAIGGNSIFAGIFHELHIIKHSDKAHGDIAHKFRGTICTCLEDSASLKGGFPKPEDSIIFPKEINERNSSAYKLA